MIRRALFLILTITLLPLSAEAVTTRSFEQNVFEKAIILCVSPMSKRADLIENAKRFAVEMTAERAAGFNEGEARLFPIPASGGQIILSIPKNGGCRLLASKVNAIAMWDQAEFFFSDKTPFKLMDVRAPGNSVEKDYKANLFGDVQLTLHVDNMPTAGEFQAIFDFKRLNEIDKKR